MTRLVLMAAVLAAACASASPAPISYGRGGPQTAQPPVYRPPPPQRRDPTPQPPPAPASRTPAAQPAPDWADGEGTALSEFALRPEDAQPYDPAQLPREHRVGASESLYDIAARYQIPLLALIEQNGLEPPYRLTPGSELELPPPRVHVAARGESFEDIARAYSVDPRSLALLNRMQAPYRVTPGQRIVLPPMAQARPPEPQAPPLQPVVTAPPAAGARFAMPIEGQIVARFGALEDGGRLDGVEIAAREGAPILAAADGQVVYAGADIEAYGTLVLVRHADNYVTAYAFARRALVAENARVRRGQPIAELGPRGDGRPRLMFQIRQGREAVDPLPLLGIRE